MVQPSPCSSVHNIIQIREKARSACSHAVLAGGFELRLPRSSIHDLGLALRQAGVDLETAEGYQNLLTFYNVNESAKNALSNRYGNIWAYGRTAVTVQTTSSPHPLYLNANVVADGKGSWWVASQAPTPFSFNIFFHALLRKSASATHNRLYPATSIAPNNQALSSVKDAIIVQLTGWFEKKVPKADNYLPTKEGLSVTHLDQAEERVSELPIVLTLQKSEEILELCSQRSTLSLRTGREGDRDQMTVHHYLFSAWPDYGVPTQPEHVDGLKKLVTEVGELQGKLKCEVWVHCSAGVGRTGTFVALSSLLNPPMSFSYQYTTALHPSPLGSLPVTQDEVAVTIDNLREQRGQMCQTEAQMELVYKLTNRQPGTAL